MTGRLLPDTLPGGRPWPRVTVAVLSPDGAVGEATRVSLRDQAPVRVELLELADGGSKRGAAIAEILRRAEGDHVVILDDGDRLAPGSLAMALIRLFVEAADVVAGLRVRGDAVVDVIALPPGPLHPGQPLLAADGRTASCPP